MARRGSLLRGKRSARPGAERAIGGTTGRRPAVDQVQGRVAGVLGLAPSRPSPLCHGEAMYHTLRRTARR